MSVEIFEPKEDITFTQRGRDKGEFLRIYIEGGGCSGFQYGFKMVKDIDEDDIILDLNGPKVAIDTMSFQYLMNSEVDYKEDLMGSMFVISNPQAKSTCGCGLSFTV